jgi:hypothetical protein
MSAMPDDNELINAALGYAARGWHVVPLHNPAGAACSCGKGDNCSSPAKHPRTEHGLKDATTDPAIIGAWWARWPNANIGLRTGIGFDVLDIDGDEGRASLHAALEQHGPLPKGPVTRTGGGGAHILFATTGGGNRAGILPKVDWRGRNGYIVAPPSVHISGQSYRWFAAPTAEPPEAPAWLRNIVAPPKATTAPGAHKPLPVGVTDGTPYGLQALEGEIADLRRAGEGTRNATLNECAYALYQLVAGGELSEYAVEQQLRDAAIGIGLGDHEIGQTIASARSAGLQHARNAPELKMVYGGRNHHALEPAPPPIDDYADDNTPIDPELLEGIAAEYGITGPDAWKMAEQVTVRVTYERVTEYARKLTRDARLVREADLETIGAVNVAELLAQERPERAPLFGALMAQGHNATVVARWKVGKSTFVDNAAIAAASGGSFLGNFHVPQPQRVVIFNYELHEDDMADRLSKYAIPASALSNIVVVNLRGRRLPIGTTKGRDIAVELLNGLGAQLWIVDPFGAAFAAAGGEDENSNAEVRRFLIAIDEIKRLSDCQSLLMPVHTGRRVDQEGDEQGRGATVLEDWPDVRMLLTRGQKEQREHRFLRTEGRAWELDESRLTFDPASAGLGLPSSDVGVSRSKAKVLQNARVVLDAVRSNAGINRNDLFDAVAELGLTSNVEKAKALDEARRSGLVHFHEGFRAAHHHYVGAHHDESDPCPGGWKNRD